MEWIRLGIEALTGSFFHLENETNPNEQIFLICQDLIKAAIEDGSPMKAMKKISSLFLTCHYCNLELIHSVRVPLFSKTAAVKTSKDSIRILQGLLGLTNCIFLSFVLLR
jgi:hypothetical protein